MPRIAYHTLGCKLNFAETSTYRRALEAAGCETAPWNASDADVYLLNTCAVTTVAEKKSRGLIRQVHRRAPQARIVVTGCYAELRAAEIAALEGVAAVLGANQKNELVASVLALTHRTDQVTSEDPVIPSEDPVIPSEAKESVLAAYSSGDRTRSFLKVQDGCNNFCAYCTVPYARGRSRNLPICEIVRQAREIAATGTLEIVLTGVNTGDFGRSTGESFLDLLKALQAVEGIARYRISSIEPNLLTEEIIDWIATEGTKFLPHFHIPLQSGSDAVLKNVGRRYTTELFASRIDYIRKKMGPKVFFGIDVIAGLPGETEEEFERSYGFLRDRIHPAFLHVFPFSPRPGTRAWTMGGQVQESVRTARAARLEALCEELHTEFVASCKGTRETVLWESARKGGMMEGYTGNYIRLERPYDPALAGTLQEVVL